jgi:short-subunit dehydrogenase
LDKADYKTAIVTGGASGIGEGLCRLLAQQGVFVVVADIDADGAAALAQELEREHGRAGSFTIDVACPDQVEKLISDTVARHGRLDYMFNNAGIAPTEETLDATLAGWRRAAGINLDAVIVGSLAAYRVMVKQGFGHIVNTASVLGLMPMPMASFYTATKHAVLGFTMALRAEARDLGVRVNVVCPGLIATAIKDNTVTLLGQDAQTQANLLPSRGMKPLRCAAAILRGVKRNKPIIIVPRRWVWMWASYQWGLPIYDRWITPIITRRNRRRIERKRQHIEAAKT